MSDSLFGTNRHDIKWSRSELQAQSLKGKRVLVVGGTGGIGQAMARVFVDKGADVTVVGRSFRDVKGANLKFIHCDLENLKSARDLAQNLPAESFDLVLMTHGVFAGKVRRTNAAGIEFDMAVSYLSRFVLARELAGRLGKSRNSHTSKPRVFIMGFPGKKRQATLDDFNSERNYKWFEAHSNTVVGNEALVLDCAKRYPEVNFFGLNPGIMQSNIMSGVLGDGTLRLKMQQIIIGILFQSVQEYAQKIVPLLVSPDLETHSGAMIGRFGDAIYTNPTLLDPEYVRRIMVESEKLAERGLNAHP